MSFLNIIIDEDHKFPYLHWDTVGAVRARNDLLKKISPSESDKYSRETFFDSASDEKKIIWQYATDNSHLPLHPRRTLDQYGYPDLENTEFRDQDQVLTRWIRDVDEKRSADKNEKEKRKTKQETQDNIFLPTLWPKSGQSR